MSGMYSLSPTPRLYKAYIDGLYDFVLRLPYNYPNNFMTVDTNETAVCDYGM